MHVQEQQESLDFVLSEACGRQGREKPQLVLSGATLPKEAQLQAYEHKVLHVPSLLHITSRHGTTCGIAFLHAEHHASSQMDEERMLAAAEILLGMWMRSAWRGGIRLPSHACEEAHLNNFRS